MARWKENWLRLSRTVAFGDIAQRSAATLWVWIRLLCMANWKEGNAYLPGQQIKLGPGQVATGLEELANGVVTIGEVRGALKFLEKSGRISQAPNNHGRIITIEKWTEYQSSNDEVNRQLADTSQAPNKHLATSEESRRNKVEEREPSSSKADDSLPRLAVLWNEHGGNLAKVKKSNASRNKKARARLAECSEDEWIECIKQIAASDFCNGKSERGWRATFDWLLQPEVRLKVLEGKYDNPGAFKRESPLDPKEWTKQSEVAA